MKRLIAIALALPVLFGCATISQQEHLAASRSTPGEIVWPDEYQPEEASWFLHNRIDIAAPPEVVWNILVSANDWSDWYEGASDVQLPDGAARLSDGMEFRWKTMGQEFTTTIREFEPPYRMGWDSRKRSIRAYHAWLIVPTENGCTVITDEAQHGFLTTLQRVFQPNKLHRLHDIWLAELKARAESQMLQANWETP